MMRDAGWRRRFVVMAALLAPASLMAQGYEIPWYTVDGGGVTVGAGGSYTLSGTIAQPDASAAAALTGGGYSLTGGFWAVIPVCASFVAPDFDRDCDVDMNDSAAFEGCASGPGIPFNTGCEAPDFDSDADVDQTDFAVFQRCFSGEGVSVIENCDN